MESGVRQVWEATFCTMSSIAGASSVGASGRGVRADKGTTGYNCDGLVSCDSCCRCWGSHNAWNKPDELRRQRIVKTIWPLSRIELDPLGATYLLLLQLGHGKLHGVT